MEISEYLDEGKKIMFTSWILVQRRFPKKDVLFGENPKSEIGKKMNIDHSWTDWSSECMRDSNTRVNKQPNKNICLHVNLFTCLHSLWRHAAFPDIAFKKNKIYHKLSISFPFNRRTKAFDWSRSNESNRRTHPFNDISARVCINA